MVSSIIQCVILYSFLNGLIVLQQYCPTHGVNYPMGLIVLRLNCCIG